MVEETIKKNIQKRFAVFPDWTFLIGAALLLPLAAWEVLTDLLLPTSMESVVRIIGNVMWIAFLSWILKRKIKKFKQLRPTEEHRWLLKTILIILSIASLPAILSFIVALLKR